MMRHPLGISLLSLLVGCGGGGRYAGTWEGACELPGEVWGLSMTLERSDGEPAGTVFVTIDAFGYERYYSGTVEGVQDGEALSLSATVTPVEDPDAEGRDLDLELILDGDELSGDCSGDDLDGVASLALE